MITDAMHPVPSPKGDQIAFASDRWSGRGDIYLRSTGGQNQDDGLLVRTDQNKWVCDWSRDGRYILFESINTETKGELWLQPMFGDRTPVAFQHTPYSEIQGRISPDGRWIAYTSDESGAWEVYVQSFPKPGFKQVVSIGGGYEPQWRGDGQELFYRAEDGTISSVDIQLGATSKIGRPKALFKIWVSRPSLFRNYYAVSGDGQRFLIDSTNSMSSKESISILVNWPARLPRSK
jgi:Tol biopolymer transport system component